MLQIISQNNYEIKISKPKTEYSTRLISFLFTFIFGSVFSLISIIIFSTLFSDIGVLKISCDRIETEQVDCQISKSQYFDLVQQKPLNYKLINSARSNITKATDITGNFVYRSNILLITEYGTRIPFTVIKPSTTTKVITSLNSFIRSKQESFNYVLDERLDFPVAFVCIIFFLLVLLFIWGVGAIWISLSILIDYEELYLDKYKRELIYTNRTLFGTKIHRYLFDEVTKINVLEVPSKINLVFTTKLVAVAIYLYIPRIVINAKSQFKLAGVKDRQVAINIANSLNRFMGLPEEEDPVVKQ